MRTNSFSCCYLYSCLATHAENELIYRIFIPLLNTKLTSKPLSLEAWGSILMIPIWLPPARHEAAWI